jgi:hypothetical protein
MTLDLMSLSISTLSMDFNKMSAVMPSVIMVNVIMMNVVVPRERSIPATASTVSAITAKERYSLQRCPQEKILVGKMVWHQVRVP